MQANPRPDALQTPTDPYPGLRPFLDNEAALLFGRARQVREVIERLQQTQFVVVIGGSGSGKSSLVRAGVIPELRSYGIAGAGDFWLPLVCTPGTNAAGAGDANAKSSAEQDSPIARLAWKFAQLLRSRGSPHEDAERLGEIASVFQQEAGFARLIDTYSDELAVPPGPNPADARLLFVIDQFEELFHPTNTGVEDCVKLVERIIDHFFNPHPRCFVVLTMRSEHLNDCAGFLELPDAINKSSYLVRRLDPDELKEAIEAPAQRFLRLLARQDNEGDALPDAVRFEPAVRDRVLRDVQAIAHDPDHLPLLQHLLARLWQMACERSRVRVPAEITYVDLRRAALAEDDPGGAAINDRRNVVRMSLENWAERIYQRSDASKPAIDAMLRRLAFKDPNTGLYTQQRINVDAVTEAELRSLVQGGFVRGVDYLFWDNENPERVTLKVSHESFIRGWPRFRKLIDREAERFEEFHALLRDCAAWVNSGKRARCLLESGALRRFGEAQLAEVLRDPLTRQDWFRFVLLARDGPRLAKLEPEIDEFVAASQGREAMWRTGVVSFKVLAGSVVVIIALTVLPTLYAFQVQAPVTERAGQLFEASQRVWTTPPPASYADVGAAKETLDSLLKAGEKLEGGKIDQLPYALRWVFEHFDNLNLIKTPRNLLVNAAAVTEPQVNGALRSVLTGAVWRLPTPRRAAGEAIEGESYQDVTCTVGSVPGVRGDLLVTAARGDQRQRRGIFVPLEPSAEIALRGATVVGQGPDMECQSNSVLWSIPADLKPQMLFDASLRYVLAATAGRNDVLPSVSVYQLTWDNPEDGDSGDLDFKPLIVLTGADAVGAVRREAGQAIVKWLDTRRVAGGRAFMVDGQGWRLVATTAHRLTPQPADAAMQELKQGEACTQLEQALNNKNQPGFSTSFFDGDGHCFAITRGNPPPPEPDSGAAKQDATGSRPELQREEVFLNVYTRPLPDALPKIRSGELVLVPVASIREFGRIPKDQRQWHIGTDGPYKGWIALHLRLRDGGGERFMGAPWSTKALMELGNAVLNDQAGAAAEPVNAGVKQ